MTPIVSVYNLNFAYNNDKDHSVLKNVSVEFPTGSIVAIMGINGSGKSTFLNCLIGQLPIPQRTIMIQKRDVSTASPQELAKEVSYVPQFPSCNPSLTVLEYLSLGCLSGKAFWARPNEQDYENISEKVSIMGIEKLLNKHINRLSGGERQLIVITRALIQDTPVIVMDEPASALDISNQAILLKVLQQLKELGKTVIFSTHDPNHALALNATTCLFHNASLLCSGPANDVLTIKTLSQAYGKNLRFVYDQNKKVCSFDI